MQIGSGVALMSDEESTAKRLETVEHVLLAQLAPGHNNEELLLLLGEVHMLMLAAVVVAWSRASRRRTTPAVVGIVSTA